MNEESRPYSDRFAEAATLAQNLVEIEELSSPHRNPLFSASDYSTDFALEEFYWGAAMEMNEFEDILFSHQSNMQRVNSPPVARHEIMNEFYDNMENVNWIHELDYLHNLDS